jgi:uncharacterized protein with NRDE domain
MCLIFISINKHPSYKLIIAANRDEFYNRKTAPADFWTDQSHILGGRDMEAAGTWMAMNRNGKISMVTNYRDPANINPKAPSRGQLVSNYLMNGDKPNEYLEQLLPFAPQYNGFNLLVGNMDTLWYYSNYGKGIQQLNAGIFGLSNHLLDTPWPKVSEGKQKFSKAISTYVVAEDDLFDMLYDEQQAHDEHLPDTGIGLERERALSSMFIKTNGYGTRCSTVITVTKNNEVTFAERVYDLDTFVHQTRRFEFLINDKA